MSFPVLSRKIRAGQAVKVCLFGSSTLEGIGASAPEHGFPAVFERHFSACVPGGLTIIPRGIGGDDAQAMHERVQDILDTRSDLIIWQGGTNDVWRDRTTDEFMGLTREDLLSLRENGADLAMISQQWCPMLEEAPEFPAFLSAVQTVAQELNIPLYDRCNAMKKWGRDYGLSCLDLSPDQVHTNDFGYSLLGKDVARWIGEGLVIPSGREEEAAYHGRPGASATDVGR